MHSAPPYDAPVLVTRDDLAEVFRFKHGAPQTAGRAPRLRASYGYFTPDDYFQAAAAALADEGCRWLHVGGRLFPDNPRLARQLARRCGLLVGLDPEAARGDDPHLHQCVRGTLADFRAAGEFDLVTLRLGSAGVGRPEAAVEALQRLLRPGGKVVVAATGGVTPRQLGRLFGRNGFLQCYCAYLDDCRKLERFGWLHRLELAFWRLLKDLQLPYPATCLLAVYERG